MTSLQYTQSKNSGNTLAHGMVEEAVDVIHVTASTAAHHHEW
jgi:hypothetical protein